METHTVTRAGVARSYVYDATRIPARYRPSRVMTLAFRRGWSAAVGDYLIGRRRPCPYSRPYTIEAWAAGYQYAAAQYEEAPCQPQS